MSGGRYNYAFRHVEDAAQEIASTTPEREAFCAHLRKVSKALHDIEWVDSCDYGTGDENAAILACIGAEAVTEAAIVRLSAEIERAQAVLRGSR